MDASGIIVLSSFSFQHFMVIDNFVIKIGNQIKDSLCRVFSDGVQYCSIYVLLISSIGNVFIKSSSFLLIFLLYQIPKHFQVLFRSCHDKRMNAPIL